MHDILDITESISINIGLCFIRIASIMKKLNEIFSLKASSVNFLGTNFLQQFNRGKTIERVHV